MRARALGLSLAIHLAAVAAAWWEGSGGGETVHPPPRVTASTPLLAPPPGTTPHRRDPRSSRPAAGSRTGGPVKVNLDSIELTLDDRYAPDLTAVLHRWKGRITDCSTASGGAILRFWLYDPAAWPETSHRSGIPCADFPVEFRSELAFRIGEEASRRGLQVPVRRAVIGFTRKLPAGVVILQVGG